MCRSELLPIYIVSGKFTAEQYRDVLSELYWPVLREKFAESHFLYIQDNSPIHRGRAVTEWLETEPAFRDAVRYLPPYSPGLNPIEHVWSRMKVMLSNRIYDSVQSLSTAVLEAWHEIGQDREFLSQVSSSCIRRLDACIESNGGPTRY